MERRDRIVLQKVLSEINVAQEMMGHCSLDQFRQSEMLMRAASMTVINIGELVKTSRMKPALLIPIFRGRPLPASVMLRRTNTRPFVWRMFTKPLWRISRR